MAETRSMAQRWAGQCSFFCTISDMIDDLHCNRTVIYALALARPCDPHMMTTLQGDDPIFLAALLPLPRHGRRVRSLKCLFEVVFGILYIFTRMAPLR